MNKLSTKAIPMAVTSALPFAPLLSVNESCGFHRGNGKTPFIIRSVLNPAWDISEANRNFNTKINQTTGTFTFTNLLH
jgi:hypothetical protein